MKIPLYLQTLIALLMGAVAGSLLGESAAPLGQVSKWIIEIIKTVAMPVLFVTITDAIYSATIKLKGVSVLLGVATINGLCAITIALLLTNLIQPGSYLPLDGSFLGNGFSKGDLFSGISRSFTSNPKASIFSGTTLIITLSILTGVILLFFPKSERIQNGLKKALDILFKIIGWVVHLIPIAVFCSVAKVIGLYGKSFVGGLLVYLVVCLLGMAIHVGIIYQSWIRFFTKIPVRLFWKEAKDPVIHSFGINSSLATLPITLTTLKKLKVSDGASRLGACIGTNLNNDGILLYEVFATIFLAQAYGVNLSLVHQLMLALLCVVATIGVAGVPEAGIISLSLLASAIGLPLESIPILLTVDWILARVRSMVNVTGDLTVSIVIDRFITGDFSSKR